MDKIISLDYSLTSVFNKSIPHNLFFNYFFSFFSLTGESILIWLIIIVLLIIFEEKINKKFVIYFLVSLIITFLVVFVMKHVTQRIRPTELCGKDFSFPSGHAATAFAAATILAFFDKKRNWFYYAVAVLIAYSRIYLGCHYFLDVVAGAVLGWLISITILKLPQFSPGTSPSRRKS